MIDKTCEKCGNLYNGNADACLCSPPWAHRVDDGYRECAFCGEDIIPNSECYCVQAIAFRDGEERGDARVRTLLEAIGSQGECKKCGEDVFFVLHHSDRGENPKAGFANKHRWRKWMRFDPNGERHKCAE